MTLHLNLPDDVAKALAEQASATGTQPEQLIITAIRRSFSDEAKLEAALAPVRDAFLQSAMTEDEAVELFEAEKHAWRSSNSN